MVWPQWGGLYSGGEIRIPRAGQCCVAWRVSNFNHRWTAWTFWFCGPGVGLRHSLSWNASSRPGDVAAGPWISLWVAGVQRREHGLCSLADLGSSSATSKLSHFRQVTQLLCTSSRQEKWFYLSPRVVMRIKGKNMFVSALQGVKKW